jgi:hypothetical protein
MRRCHGGRAVPIFVEVATGMSVEVIRTRPRRAEMPEGVRRRLMRDAAMLVLRREGWPPASIAEVFDLTPRWVRARVEALEGSLGRDDEAA